MTAKDALDVAKAAEPGERLGRFTSAVWFARRLPAELCERDPGRWTWCPDCLTVYDEHGSPVNAFVEFRTAHFRRARCFSIGQAIV